MEIYCSRDESEERISSFPCNFLNILKVHPHTPLREVNGMNIVVMVISTSIIFNGIDQMKLSIS